MKQLTKALVKQTMGAELTDNLVIKNLTRQKNQQQIDETEKVVKSLDWKLTKLLDHQVIGPQVN